MIYLCINLQECVVKVKFYFPIQLKGIDKSIQLEVGITEFSLFCKFICICAITRADLRSLFFLLKSKQ